MEHQRLHYQHYHLNFNVSVKVLAFNSHIKRQCMKTMHSVLVWTLRVMLDIANTPHAAHLHPPNSHLPHLPPLLHPIYLIC